MKRFVLTITALAALAVPTVASANTGTALATVECLPNGTVFAEFAFAGQPADTLNTANLSLMADERTVATGTASGLSNNILPNTLAWVAPADGRQHSYRAVVTFPRLGGGSATSDLVLCTGPPGPPPPVIGCDGHVVPPGTTAPSCVPPPVIGCNGQIVPPGSTAPSCIPPPPPPVTDCYGHVVPPGTVAPSCAPPTPPQHHKRKHHHKLSCPVVRPGQFHVKFAPQGLAHGTAIYAASGPSSVTKITTTIYGAGPISSHVWSRTANGSHVRYAFDVADANVFGATSASGTYGHHKVVTLFRFRCGRRVVTLSYFNNDPPHAARSASWS